MPKYLLHANYVGDGIKGLLKEGGTSRKAAAEQAIKSLGGKVEAFYYAFGDTDVYVIAELPDNASMAATARFWPSPTAMTAAGRSVRSCAFSTTTE